MVCSLPPQCLQELIEPDHAPGVPRHLDNLHEPSGAIVLYGALERRDALRTVQAICSAIKRRRALCFSPSAARAMGVRPRGSHLDCQRVHPNRDWHTMEEEEYQQRKQELLTTIRMGVN